MRKFFRKIIVFILQWQAKIYLKKFKPDIILICGQNNRTDIKQELVKKFAANGYNVRGSLKGYNSEIGVPLSILNLKAGFSPVLKWLKLILTGLKIVFSKKNEQAEILVLEVAIDKIKELDKLFLIRSPKILILSDFKTNFSLKNGKKFWSLINRIIGGSKVILNSDYYSLGNFKGQMKNNIYTFGFNKEADLRVFDVNELDDFQEFNYAMNREVRKAKLNNFGIHSIYSYVIARFVIDNYKNNS